MQVKKMRSSNEVKSTRADLDWSSVVSNFSFFTSRPWTALSNGTLKPVSNYILKMKLCIIGERNKTHTHTYRHFVPNFASNSNNEKNKRYCKFNWLMEPPVTEWGEGNNCIWIADCFSLNPKLLRHREEQTSAFLSGKGKKKKKNSKDSKMADCCQTINSWHYRLPCSDVLPLLCLAR